MISEVGWAGAALRSLKGHPSEILATVCLIAGVTLLLRGVDPYVSIGFPGTIFVLNGLVMVVRQRHIRHMAEIEVRQIESLEGAAIRAKAKKALERRRNNNG